MTVDQHREISLATRGKHTSELKKMTILDIAKAGGPRPSDKTSLGRVLRQYLYEPSRSYDPQFSQEIARIAPHWLEKKYDSKAKKEKIFEFASQGVIRSVLLQNDLESFLRSYTTRSNTAYDSDFDVNIRKAAPQWFRKGDSDRKDILITLAKAGAPRPKRSTSLGRFLTNCKDLSFLQSLYNLVPDWK